MNYGTPTPHLKRYSCMLMHPLFIACTEAGELWPLTCGRDVRMNEGGGVRCGVGGGFQHPPTLTGLELGGDGTGTGCGEEGFFWGRGEVRGAFLPDRQLLQ